MLNVQRISSSQKADFIRNAGKLSLAKTPKGYELYVSINIGKPRNVCDVRPTRGTIGRPHITLFHIIISFEYVEKIKAYYLSHWQEMLINQITTFYSECFQDTVLTRSTNAVMGKNKQFLVTKYEVNAGQEMEITNFRIKIYNFLDHLTGEGHTKVNRKTDTHNVVILGYEPIIVSWAPLHSFGRGVMSWHMTVCHKDKLAMDLHKCPDLACVLDNNNNFNENKINMVTSNHTRFPKTIRLASHTLDAQKFKFQVSITE